MGRYEEAIASYDKGLEFKPDDDAAWNNRGIALGNLGRYEEAIASFDKALEINPNNANIYYNKACSYSLQNNLELAIQNLQQAIKLDEQYREMAKTDQDVDNIRDHELFQTLINLYTSNGKNHE
ncbi:TPR repeat-containing protein [Rippkaea orientalis PCC 8801]|uniref:TPR repeat-containing protein n=1 Tax=Rippkaea orientalis (strain PCC 8801 / RF-1) TaxID=41431 RepID=B7JXS9_RIPO1|nr:TPR repeat-containing protein [Rippkaea orientalis PCC 8801]